MHAAPALNPGGPVLFLLVHGVLADPETEFSAVPVERRLHVGHAHVAVVHALKPRPAVLVVVLQQPRISLDFMVKGQRNAEGVLHPQHPGPVEFLFPAVRQPLRVGEGQQCVQARLVAHPVAEVPYAGKLAFTALFELERPLAVFHAAQVQGAAFLVQHVHAEQVDVKLAAGVQVADGKDRLSDTDDVGFHCASGGLVGARVEKDPSPLASQGPLPSVEGEDCSVCPLPRGEGGSRNAAEG